MGSACCTVYRVVCSWYVFKTNFVEGLVLNFVLGCDRLAAIEENIVTAFTEVGSDDNNRLIAILNRAYKVGMGDSSIIYPY